HGVLTLRRWGDLLNAAGGLAVVPDVDGGRLDAQGRQRGADLAAMVAAVVQHLRQANADRGAGLRVVLVPPDNDGVRIGMLREEPRPFVRVPLRDRPQVA